MQLLAAPAPSLGGSELKEAVETSQDGIPLLGSL